jgi:hypothetical protein
MMMIFLRRPPARPPARSPLIPIPAPGRYRGLRGLAGSIRYTAAERTWTAACHCRAPLALRAAVAAVLLCHGRQQARGRGRQSHSGAASHTSLVILRTAYSKRRLNDVNVRACRRAGSACCRATS